MGMLYAKEKTILPIVNQAAKQYGLDPALILAHIREESNFDPNAHRPEPQIKDASWGLMQILVGTAKTLDKKATAQKLLNPIYNINLGAKYIAQNLRRYGGDIKHAVAAYNAGSAYKTKEGKYVSGSGRFDVQKYVDKVMDRFREYSEWLARGAKSVDVSISVGTKTIPPVVVIGAVTTIAIIGIYFLLRK